MSDNNNNKPKYSGNVWTNGGAVGIFCGMFTGIGGLLDIARVGDVSFTGLGAGVGALVGLIVMNIAQYRQKKKNNS